MHLAVSHTFYGINGVDFPVHDVEMCLANPDVRSIRLDLDEIEGRTRESVSAHGLDNRIYANRFE